jgi:D-sedoheptulose 7-phosphate isomerase
MLRQSASTLRGVLEVMEQNDDLLKQYQIMVDKIRSALERGNKILVCGCGGSAADAQHFAAELTSWYRDRARRPYRCVALCDVASMSAVANDDGFDQVYARQVAAHGDDGDVLLCISTSGASPSVFVAAKVASGMDIEVVAVVGNNPCVLDEFCAAIIHVPSTITARVQEVQKLIMHSICEELEEPST